MEPNMNRDQLQPDQQHQLLFMMLIQQHEQIAMMGLGKIKNPASGNIERDLSSAKFAIDTLNMLQVYTEGNIGKDLKQFLDQTLTNLRLNYADEKGKGERSKSEEDGSEKAD